MSHDRMMSPSGQKAMYETPYRIMQLRRDIQEKCKEIKVMRNKLNKLEKEIKVRR